LGAQELLPGRSLLTLGREVHARLRQHFGYRPAPHHVAQVPERALKREFSDDVALPADVLG
jgi:hypothetical protein